MSWRTIDNGHDWADDLPPQPWERTVANRPSNPKKRGRKRKKPEGGAGRLEAEAVFSLDNIRRQHPKRIAKDS